jgi:hypothetical protein
MEYEIIDSLQHNQIDCTIYFSKMIQTQMLIRRLQYFKDT